MATLIIRPNGIYYYVFSVKGKRVWRSTQARSREEAEKTLDGFLSELQPYKVAKPTVTQFREQFLPYARTNMAPGTVLLYEAAIKTYIRIMGDKRMDLYGIADAERFKTHRLSEKVSPSKVNIDFRCIKAYFQVAVKWGLISQNPFNDVKQLRIPQMRPVFLTKEEFSTLISVIPDEWFRDLVTFAIMTMMRVGEIVNLFWESVDLKNRLIHVENKVGFSVKSRRPRTIPMNDWVHQMLSRKQRGSGYVFRLPGDRKLNTGWVSRKFKNAVKASGVRTDIHFHSLRHTGASWLVQSGASIYVVQKLLGHSSISVTMGYSHLVTDELHNVVNTLSRIGHPCVEPSEDELPIY